MSSGLETTQRFLRPADVARIRRNQHRIDVLRALAIARNAVLTMLVIAAIVWIWRETQSDARFAVKTIDVAGAVHTAGRDLEAVTGRYRGANLFRLDIAQVQDEIRALPWVRRVDVEKKLPDTLKITVTERRP